MMWRERSRHLDSEMAEVSFEGEGDRSRLELF